MHKERKLSSKLRFSRTLVYYIWRDDEKREEQNYFLHARFFSHTHTKHTTTHIEHMYNIYIFIVARICVVALLLLLLRANELASIYIDGFLF